MLEYIDNLKGSTTIAVQTTADTIDITPALVKRLSVLKDGSHIYLSLKYLDRYEVVKFTKDGEIRRNKISVERDVLGTGRKNFPARSCIEADWNSVQLKEFLCQSKGNC